MGIMPARITALNDCQIQPGKWVLCWMQQSQRSDDNPALETAVDQANRLRLPVLVVFGLTDAYPQANLRHYFFMLEGLRETAKSLARRRIQLLVQHGHPPTIAARYARKAALVVCDVGYLRHQKKWRRELADQVHCRVLAVEGDVVVPVALVSSKAEYAARTIRPKIHRHLETCLMADGRHRLRHGRMDLVTAGLDLADIDGLLARLDIDRSVPVVSRFFKGGSKEAKRRLRRFVNDRLPLYAARRNQPQWDATTELSPYLHFGQISPVRIVRAVCESVDADNTGRQALVEELVIRRELAINFVHYTADYDRYDCLPAWVRKTLAEHAQDPRPDLYDPQTLAAADTHDPFWNAAMNEMRTTGYMHGYMRMYWGKKVLEWSSSPQKAFDTLLAMNNKYFLDGRDPSSYVGVAWIFGLHDRAWFQRPIFGKVRYMAASGLKRKCDIDGYVEKVKRRQQKAADR